MKLSDVLTEKDIKLNFEAKNKEDAIKKLVALFCSAKGIKDRDKCQKLESLVLEREKSGTTGVGHGIALPHARVDGIVDDVSCFLAIARKPIEFESLDGQPVNILLLIISPRDVKDRYIKLLAHATRVLRHPEVREKLASAKKPSGVLEVIRGAES